jgi:hypothetical protein
MTVSDDAALASNWRRILLIDALLGLAAVAIGIWRGGFFLVLVAAGAAYDVAIYRRYLRWRRIRQASQGQ